MRQVRFRMIICLPTMACAGNFLYTTVTVRIHDKTRLGTLITNFIGPFRIAKEISDIFTEEVLENHPLGRQSLGCTWILAFTILRTMAEQLDFAFEIFDPLDSSAVRVLKCGFC